MKRFQHYFNALHVFCFFCKLGIPKKRLDESPNPMNSSRDRYFTLNALAIYGYPNLIRRQAFLEE